jgi:hypothetical protein
VAIPTLCLYEASTSLGKDCGITVIVDHRDMWPEMFVEIVPNSKKPK